MAISHWLKSIDLFKAKQIFECHRQSVIIQKICWLISENNIFTLGNDRLRQTHSVHCTSGTTRSRKRTSSR